MCWKDAFTQPEFTQPDYDLIRKLTLIPLLHREGMKYAHSHKIQKIVHNMVRQGLNFLYTCWKIHSLSQTINQGENEHSFRFSTGKR
jgi:hypothetical protein